MMTYPTINGARLLSDIEALGAIGRDDTGRLTRLACTEEDRLGRDLFVRLAQDAGLVVRVDEIGNIFAFWSDGSNEHRDPILVGSHIDTVVDAGMLDGCYGVLAGLEVVRTLREAHFAPARPIVVAAFTNEEGARFAPDMMGSAVFAGAIPANDARAAVDADGQTLGAGLSAIGYAGPHPAGFFRPSAYLELHIEQGPVLDAENVQIGVVESLQSILWQRITLGGQANHAGTTPMALRRDAGWAAAALVCFVNEQAERTPGLVATAGTIAFSPGAINVVPGSATLTLDIRCPDDKRLMTFDRLIADFVERLCHDRGLDARVEELARSKPVMFDVDLANHVEHAAQYRDYTCRRMASGAGHDAQMLAPIVPSAMIFVPSIAGVSHSPDEQTAAEDLCRGAQVLLDVVAAKASV